MTRSIDRCETLGGAPTRATLRRSKVIDTARTLFADNGFHATGIAQIAKLSGVAVGQIYRDFASKEDIVAQIVSVDSAAFMARAPLEEAIAQDDREAVRAWIRNFVNPLDKTHDGRLFAEIVAESSRNDRMACLFTAVHEDARHRMLIAVDIFAPGPALAPARAMLADTILTIGLGLIHHRLMAPDRVSDPVIHVFERIIDQEIDALERMGEGIT